MTIITRTLIKSIIVNIFLTISKIIAGFVGNSAALIADGIHSLSDMITDIIGIGSDRYVSKNDADLEHPYGHGQLHYLVALLSGIVMLYIAYVLIRSVFTADPLIPSAFVIIVIVITLVSKLILARYIYRIGVKHNVNLLKASGQESKADAYSSIVILLSVIAAQFYEQYAFLMYADKVAVVIVALFIVHTAFGIIKENIGAVLNEHDPNTDFEEEIENVIKKHYPCAKIDKLILIKFGFYYKLDLKIILKDDKSIKTLARNNHTIKAKLQKNLPIKYFNISVCHADICYITNQEKE